MKFSQYPDVMRFIFSDNSQNCPLASFFFVYGRTGGGGGGIVLILIEICEGEDS